MKNIFVLGVFLVLLNRINVDKKFILTLQAEVRVKHRLLGELDECVVGVVISLSCGEMLLMV